MLSKEIYSIIETLRIDAPEAYKEIRATVRIESLSEDDLAHLYASVTEEHYGEEVVEAALSKKEKHFVERVVKEAVIMG